MDARRGRGAGRAGGGRTAPGAAGGKGGGRGRPAPYADPSSPCGYFVAGHCRFGARCDKQHSIPYAMAIRQEWLSPGDPVVQERLLESAIRAIGEDEVAASELFPRAFSQRLGARTASGPAPALGAGRRGGRQARWRRDHRDRDAAGSDAAGAAPDVAEDDGDDGFIWERSPEEVGPRRSASVDAGAACGGDDSAARRPRDGDASVGDAWADACPGPRPGQPKLRHLLVLDLEGKDEIIEFPVLAIDVAKRQELGRFQLFVRPHRLFSGLALTTDSPAVPFSEVLRQFDEWLATTLGHSLFELAPTTAILTCGDWDCKHIHTQCGICEIPVPDLFRRWVNIKRSYADAYGGEFRGMKSMLARIGMLDRQGLPKFGFHHLGMHDVENISRCVLHLLSEGYEININGWWR